MGEIKYYIRFGEIPENETSSIYLGGVKLGDEFGVSVYDAVEMTDGWHVIMPLPITSKQGTTYLCLSKQNRNVYLVTGDEIGYGSDEEPVLKNVKIIKDITEKIYKED